MSNKVYDISLVPLDSTAARAIAKGEHWQPKLKDDPNREIWDINPGIIPHLGPHQYNLSGKKFGRFEVVGLYKAKTKKKKAIWLVRCRCGMYETRRAKAINNQDNNNDMCKRCRKLVYLRERSQGNT